jgi:hypothetical protein
MLIFYPCCGSQLSNYLHFINLSDALLHRHLHFTTKKKNFFIFVVDIRFRDSLQTWFTNSAREHAASTAVFIMIATATLIESIFLDMG